MACDRRLHNGNLMIWRVSSGVYYVRELEISHPLRRLRVRAAAARRRHRAKQHRGYIGRGKVWSIARFRLYPASRVSGRGPAGLGKPNLKLLQ
jgi:hypothetical protein